jgi:hypothetical protein
MNRAKFVEALLRGSPKRRSTMLNGANAMRSLLALGLLMTLCTSASATSDVRTHSAGHSMNYGRHHGSHGRYNGGYSQYYGGYGQYSGGYSQYYGSPNNRGGLVGGSDSGT